MANILKIKRSDTSPAAAPTALARGELAYQEVSNILYVGSGNETSGEAANRPVVAGPLNLMPVPTDDVSVNSKKITALAVPTLDTDAATKGYVDSKAQGLDVKASVKLATNGALPNNTYTQPVTTTGVGAYLEGASNGWLDGTSANKVDAVAVALNDRVLVKNETAAKNGIYTVTALGSASAKWKLTRATDFDEDDEITSAAFTFVEQGTANANSGFVVSTDGLIEFSSSTFDGVDWSQFSGAGQVSDGDGIAKAGNVLSADLKANGGIVFESNKLAIDLGASAFTGTFPIASTDLAFGIGDGNVTKCGNAVADDDFLRIDGTTIEGRTAAEVLGDIGAAASGHDHDSDYAAATHSHAVGTGGTGLATITANGVMYGSGTGAVGVTAAGGDKAILYSNSGTPAWTTTPDGLTIDCGTF